MLKIQYYDGTDDDPKLDGLDRYLSKWNKNKQRWITWNLKIYESKMNKILK